MGTTTTRLTVDEYLALPEEQIARTELIDGEIVEMSEARLIHEIVKAAVARFLFAWQATLTGYTVLIEAGYRLTEGLVLQPDTSVIVTPSMDKQTLEEVPKGAPLVAVEVVSSEEADRLEYKIGTYLALGAREVWVVYPNRKRVYVHRTSGVARLGTGERLVSEALPGFDTPVEGFFKDLP